MHGKGVMGWVRSFVGGLTLLFGRNSAGLNRFSLLRVHARLHLLYALRALVGRAARPVRDVKLLKFRAHAPALDQLAFLFQSIFMRRDYEFACRKADPVIIDCGSNIGMSILWFKWRYPRAQITAFEPGRRAFEYLERNVTGNRLENVDLRRAAVASDPAPRAFYTDAHDEASLGASLTTRLAERATVTVQRETVDCVTLSSVLTGPVDILKIDVEGAEQEVLTELADAGMMSRISEMFVEVHHNPCNPGNRLADILAMLERAGFQTVIDAKCAPPYPRHAGKAFKCNLYARRATDSQAPAPPLIAQ